MKACTALYWAITPPAWRSYQPERDALEAEFIRREAEMRDKIRS